MTPIYETSFIVFPQDTNTLEDKHMVFGGKMLAEMDKVASISVKRWMYDNNLPRDWYAVTVGVNKVSFHRPAYLGDLVRLTGTIESVGKTSVTIRVTTEMQNKGVGHTFLMGSGLFTFCTVHTVDGTDNVPIKHEVGI